MELNKKGIFFVSIVLVIVTLLIATYTVYSQIEERKAVQKRIETMNTFLKSLEDDLPRKIFIAGFRTIFTLENKIIQTGSYIHDVNTSFQEMFFNGTYLGQSESIMDGATFSNISHDMNVVGQKININISLTEAAVSIHQIDPWNVQVTITATLNATDQSNLASWNKVFNTSSLVPISYFDDPIYIINTGGLIVEKINQTIYSSFTPASLLDHTEKHYYISNQQAPSFIDRLHGNLSANSPYGIESLVYIPSLPSSSIEPGKSIADHLYFSVSPAAGCHISGMPDWFYLGNTSLSTYNATCG